MGLVFTFSVLDSYLLYRVENGVKTGTCVACICVLGVVSGDNIAALPAASHLSLGGHVFFLCVKAWVFLQDMSTARE